MQLPDAVPDPPAVPAPAAADPFAGMDAEDRPRRRYYRPPESTCFIVLCWVVVWGFFALCATGLALRAAVAVAEGTGPGSEFATRAQLNERMADQLTRLGGWFVLLLLGALAFSLLIVIAQNLQRMGDRR